MRDKNNNLQITLTKDAAMQLLDALITWSDCTDMNKTFECKDCEIVDAVNTMAHSILSIHQDVQAEFSREIMLVLIMYKNGRNKDKFDGLNPKYISMMISYYCLKETYGDLSIRFSCSLPQCISGICRGEKFILENFDKLTKGEKE